jgi:hypothetical protein
MKKTVLKFALGTFLITSAWALAQPSITPIAAYTNHPMGYPGNALYVLPNIGGNTAAQPYDVAVTANYHYHSGNSTFVGTNNRMVLCKKNATTGAPVAMSNIDLSPLVGLPNNSPGQFCKGLLLDEVNNRIYLFGTINNNAIIARFNLNTLAIDPTFASTGAQILSTATSEVIDAVLTGSGNLAVLMNEKDANNKNFMSIIGLIPSGGWMGYDQISNSNYECYGYRFRKYSFAGLDHTFYIAGKAVNASSQSIPMIWQITESGVGPTVYSVTRKTSDSFTSPALGNGGFIDLDFLPMQIIAIGNNSTVYQGIWAKFNLTGTGNLTPISTFKNGATLPGTGPANYQFTRCLVDPDGYTIVTSFVNVSYGVGSISYITPSGNSYVTKYTFNQTHKTSGLMKDHNGNIIVGGCDIHSKGITTGKFTCYPGIWGGVVNKSIPSEITSMEENTEELSLNAYPIPATDQLTINYSGIATDASILLMDISGKKVKEVKDIDWNNQQKTINISDLKSGTYFIRLTTAEKSVMKKIVKQ